MGKLRVSAFSISLDGYGAGPDQDQKHPLGVGGEALFKWAWATRTFQKMQGKKGGAKTGVDERFADRSFRNVGAWIMGRNMFGPVRGPWPDHMWKGWWGDVPPYHTQVYVLTHHKRPPLEMKGGTTFHFETGGIRSALKRATKSAKGKDVRVGGGVSTIRQFLKAGLIDELHLAISPTLMGTGENLLTGIDLRTLGYRVAKYTPSPNTTHVVLKRRLPR